MKKAEVGAHILSGAILEPNSLDELLPNWRKLNAPVKTEVKREEFLFLTKRDYLKIPNFILPSDMKNDNNYIISLGNLCKWLAEHAESLGVDIFPGFTAKDILYENNKVISKWRKRH